MSSSGASIDQKPVTRFARLWEITGDPPDVFLFLIETPSLPTDELAQICEIDLTRRWERGIPLPIERYLELRIDLPAHHPFRERLVLAEWKQMAQNGIEPDLAEWIGRFPQLQDVLQNEHEALKNLARNHEMTGPKNVGPTVIVPGEAIAGPPAGEARNSEGQEAAQSPETIGRYRVLRVLGDGGFGRVYLSHDDVLDRQVAIKIPHRSRVKSPSDIDAYLIEARILAKLDHRNIVPVHDCGQTEDGLCFVVSKYIEGCDLSTKLKRTPLSFAAIAELTSQIADALHYAHLRRIIHRDVKPANILIDLEDQPHLVDFGIALKEEDFGKLQPTMGTVPYMSPEQLRGEGHLVDGRSDIFSLGVMLYEMLTGRRPFRPNRLSQDLAIEARPPRQIDDSIPKELERICLKALAPRVVDRYNTALDMATDLREFLRIKETAESKPVIVSDSSGSEVKVTSGHLASAHWTPIIPKGLRSFDRDDANFFLELLPGPRNREGIPDSVQFWVNRISQLDPEQTFRVGLIYGPSGCGKSSFMKAGVLPRLPQTISPLYVECTPYDTEARLLKSLRRSLPDLSHDLDLVGSLAAIRKGQVLANGRKLLIVLDQFEQWLHERASDQAGELVRALRQCDGERLQCILGVRDDFWMAVTHFMDELEVPFVRGENVAAIDLFSSRHARKVLIAIGQAYETLPRHYGDLQADQKDFIAQSVAELAQNDRIVPVQLALFAEMVKDQPWNLATLKNFGGIAGVGVTFLEETFNGRTASPNHRLHQRAARNVLKALLSDQSREIKGAMRSHQELLAVSGYEEHPRDFETLLRILDSDLRLITPTDPEGLETGEVRSGSGSANRERYYHLTHDYLVPSLRDWLTRKQKETLRGRAELSLADHAGNWAARPTARSLPSFLEWINILAFVPSRVVNGNPTERILLTKATRYYSRRILLTVAMLGLIVWGVWEQSYRSEAAALVNSLRTGSTQDVPRIIKQLEPYRNRARPALLKLLNSTESTEALHAAMSLPVDKNTEDILVSGLLAADPRSFSAIRDALLKGGNPQGLDDRLWKELQNEESSPAHRFSAGLALVRVAPPPETSPPQRWQQQFKFLADQLVLQVKSNPGSFDFWVEALLPIRKHLFDPLRETFLSNNQIDRSEAANILGVLARSTADPGGLVLSADLQSVRENGPATGNRAAPPRTV
ncbi:MAG: serine/threonine-protein kinase [Planctomycetales bacterium]